MRVKVARALATRERVRGNWVFGCDVCQQVCPWNRFSTPHTEPDFAPKQQLLDLTADEWYGMTELLFEELFHASAVKRTKFSGLKRNLAFLEKAED